MRTLLWIVMLGLVGGGIVADEGGAGEVASPDEVPGLVAWYTTASLHETHRDGDRVATWPDASRNGHDLVDDENGLHAVFRTLQVGGKPVVGLRKGNSHSVTNPFDLDDHTIFVVAAAGFSNRALFRSDTNDKLGVMLRHYNNRHVFQNGGTAPSQLIGYTEKTTLPGGYSISVLARGRNLLDGYVNGLEVSSGASLSQPIRVGKFFILEHSQFAGTDAEGLQVAEIAIYDRFLTADEREAVTRHLSAEYDLAIDLERPVVENVARWPKETIRGRLGADASADLNTEFTAVPWNRATEIAAPLRHDAKEDPTRIHSTADGTRIKLVLSLPVVTEAEGATIRINLLKNYEQYLPEETTVGPFTGSAEAELQAVVTLDAGEWIEVVATRDAGTPEGAVRPGEDARLTVRLD
jgi:hypothetical protein